MSRNFGIGGGARAGAGALASLVLLSAAAVCGDARAETLLASQTNFFSGSTSQTLSFDVDRGGVVDVQLTDLGWPDPLQSLSFFASSGTSILSSEQTAANTYEFSMTGPGAFYAHIAGVAGNAHITGLPNFGLYGVEVNFTPFAAPVPLPAGLSLLATGLVGLLGFAWLRRRSLASDPTIPSPAR
jgi:hypothetical protein